MKTPLGYRFAAGYAGVRNKKADDLALMVSDKPASAAGVFTQNQVRAAPVLRSQKHLRSSGGLAKAIIVNAGNANCATPDGDAVARKMAQAAAKLVRCPREQVLVSSTGVIGEPLPVGKIEERLPVLFEELSPDNFERVAGAIMTTDTVPKTAWAELETDDGVIRIAGMSKGAGMIMPNMATMLGYIFTDAEIKPSALQRMLKSAADQTFNCISIDSDTSTNDTVFLLANGASGVHPRGEVRDAFAKALEKVCLELALAIVRDGEGARKMLSIYVEGAASDEAAKKMAREIGNSPLVKTALAGADPNWGRILPAAGKAGVKFDPADVDIFLNGHRVCERGMRADFVEEEVQQTMDGPESVVRFHIRGKGRGQARFFTCDFTEDYIKINAEYRT